MISFREFLNKMGREGRLKHIGQSISKNLDLAGVLHRYDGEPILFDDVVESEIPVAGNLYSTRELVAKSLGLTQKGLIPALIDATQNPVKPESVDSGPVLEMKSPVDLEKLPIPFHAEMDGGPYISSGIVVANDPELGTNISFHRMMVIGKKEAAIRILPRHLDLFLERAGGELDIAVIVGSPINVLLAAAISSKKGQNELEYANALSPFKTVKLSNNIEVPSDVEFAFKAKITSEMHDEGPFVDLTGTYDAIRKQRVVRFEGMHHRKDPVWHALLPGGLEHKVLMGMPREPTIFSEVEKAVGCKGVNLTPGGCSWLHAIVSIKKHSDGDGKDAIDAAFKGHKSLKHVVIVDDDVDVDNPQEVEWAVATRFQAKSDLVVYEDEKGSSLDPSADANTRQTSKIGLDATKPLNAPPDRYDKAEWKRVNIDHA